MRGTRVVPTAGPWRRGPGDGGSARAIPSDGDGDGDDGRAGDGGPAGGGSRRNPPAGARGP